MRVSKKTIELAKLGDKKAFEEIFYVYVNYLAAFVNTIISDRQESEDIVMKVMSELPDKIKTNYEESKGNFETWLFALTKNEAFRYLKEVKKRNEVPLDVAVKLGEDGFIVSYDDFYIENLKSILEQDEYQIVVLRYVLGFKVREIAEILNISTSKVKRIFAKAFDKIQKYLKSEY